MSKLIVFCVLVFSCGAFGGTKMDWPFDQARNVMAVTTHQVIDKKLPILMVAHYEDDHSWAFTCGTTNKSEDLMLVSMGNIVNLDASLKEISDLPPGWSATRKSINDKWVREKDE